MSLPHQSSTKQKSTRDPTSFKHRLLDDEDKKTMLIIAKVENIYMNIKYETPFFVRMRWLIFSVIFFNSMFFWLFLLCTATTRNNSYCFDNLSHQFKVCDVYNANKNSNKGINNYLYVTDYDPDPIKEVSLINEKYNKFFMKDWMYFSMKSYNSLDHFENPGKYYNTVIVVTKNEDFNTSVQLKALQNKNYILFYSIVNFAGFLISNFFGSFMIDVITFAFINKINNIYYFKLL